VNDKKILIIDDDQHLLLGLTARLKHNGYGVITSMDAVSAISVARRALPDLIVLDLGLPAGDGFVVLERMKSLPDLATIPVIVLSARDPAQNRQRALDDGAVAFFQKPADNAEFLGAIRQVLGDTTAVNKFLDS
jgi:DNA-binding response OmpR family regulator